MSEVPWNPAVDAIDDLDKGGLVPTIKIQVPTSCLDRWFAVAREGKSTEV
jgi:hypothetical protein